MSFDRRSLRYHILVPSFVFIALVFASLLYIITAITTDIRKDYHRFTLSMVNGEVGKVLSTAASELTAARLDRIPVVAEAKQKSVLDAIALCWKRAAHDGVVSDARGTILLSTLPPPQGRLLLKMASAGYGEISGEEGAYHYYAEPFPLWGWRVVTANRSSRFPLTSGRVSVLVPLVSGGCLLMVGGIFFNLRRTLKEPVENMVAAVSAGELVGPTGLAEFDFIGNAVNDTVARLREKTAALEDELAERTRVERQLREKDAHIRRLLDCTEEGIFGVAPDGSCSFCNRSCLTLLGYEREEQLLGQPVGDLIQHCQDGGNDRQCHTAPPGAKLHVEQGQLRRSDGSSLPVEYWSHPVTEEGRTTGAVVTFIDISQRRLLEEQLIQAQKMESIGRLAGGVAHDFNNLLTPIIGFSELLRNELTHDPTALSRIDNVLLASDRARHLVQQLLSFSRKQVLEMASVDLNRVIHDFQSILRTTVRESVEIRLNLPQERYCIRADRHQLEQVLLNLAINAQDAIGDHGTITIETAPVLLDDEYVSHHPGIMAGRYLMLAFSDDGCGMDNETRQRIFEPFFTTKATGKGTGLGLATVYGIVRQHGGNLWVFSEPGRGTTFKCYFPLVDEMPAGEGGPSPPAAPFLAGEGRTILLAEDNDMVRTLVEELLTRRGFRVLATPDPRQALAMGRESAVDLLITDVVMPHMTGPELHARLQERPPRKLRVLYVSGYASDEDPRWQVSQPGNDLIRKPFSVTDFTKKVALLLAGREG